MPKNSFSPRLLPEDTKWMREAILVGERGRVSAPPNPWVGCLIVKNERVVGEGFHLRAGEGHAEIKALKQAGQNAQGATAYVTLEPCSHFGKTPPCSKALIESKVTRVVFGVQDTDKRVMGSGKDQLQQAGIEVVWGVCEEEVEKSLRPYLYQRRTQKPFVVAKYASSLDGQIAARDGSSKWISCDKAREDVQWLRACSQAILIGSNTAILDKPRLNVRVAQVFPLRIVLDPSGKLLPDGPLFDLSLGPLMIVTSAKASSESVSQWKKAGARVETLSIVDGSLDLEALLLLLGNEGILQLFVEGGAKTITQFYKKKLINQMVAYIAPCFLGQVGTSIFGNLQINTMQEAHRYRFSSVEPMGETIKATFDFSNEGVKG